MSRTCGICALGGDELQQCAQQCRVARGRRLQGTQRLQQPRQQLLEVRPHQRRGRRRHQLRQPRQQRRWRGAAAADQVALQSIQYRACAPIP